MGEARSMISGRWGEETLRTKDAGRGPRDAKRGRGADRNIMD